jgi:hypothetical protein
MDLKKVYEDGDRINWPQNNCQVPGYEHCNKYPCFIKGAEIINQVLKDHASSN